MVSSAAAGSTVTASTTRISGQIKFSDTYSELNGNGLVYGTMDVGQDFTLIDRGPRVVVSPSIGFN